MGRGGLYKLGCDYKTEGVSDSLYKIHASCLLASGATATSESTVHLTGDSGYELHTTVKEPGKLYSFEETGNRVGDCKTAEVHWPPLRTGIWRLNSKLAIPNGKTVNIESDLPACGRMDEFFQRYMGRGELYKTEFSRVYGPGCDYVTEKVNDSLYRINASCVLLSSAIATSDSTVHLTGADGYELRATIKEPGKVYLLEETGSRIGDCKIPDVHWPPLKPGTWKVQSKLTLPNGTTEGVERDLPVCGQVGEFFQRYVGHGELYRSGCNYATEKVGDSLYKISASCLLANGASATSESSLRFTGSESYEVHTTVKEPGKLYSYKEKGNRIDDCKKDEGTGQQ
jgi:hypothetical protein